MVGSGADGQAEENTKYEDMQPHQVCIADRSTSDGRERFDGTKNKIRYLIIVAPILFFIFSICVCLVTRKKPSTQNYYYFPLIS